MRINWSNLVIVLLLIAIFSLQTFSTSELTSSNQSDISPSHTTTTSGLQSPTVAQSQVAQSQVNNTNLRNMSMSDLYTYLQNSATIVKNSFIDSTGVHLDTTVTTARALTILKITGMTNYIIPTITARSAIFKNFGTSIDGGFPISNASAIPTIIGTYGVVESGQMLNLPLPMQAIQKDAITYINSKYQNNTKIGGFKEAYEKNIVASVHTTYYAVEALKVLGVQLNSTQKIQITDFLQSLWNSNGYFNNTYDSDQSVILTSFQAISILNDIGTNSSLWTDVTSHFSQFIKANQDQTGVFTGGIHSPGAVASVDDTGSAISALYILNQTNAINIGSADQFMLQSQYNGTAFPNDLGGFANNNSTFVATSQSSGVTLAHTYYAMLGLYASGYISNHTVLSFETQYSTNNDFNKLTNEIPVGQNSTFTAQLSSFNYKNYYGELNVQFSVDKLNVQANGTNEANTALGSQYNFEIYNASSNFYLGLHPLTATYSLTNFTILPVMNNIFHSSINVRFPLNNALNGLSSSVQVNPGDTLIGKMGFGNNTVNATNFRTATLGNVSVSLIYPNGTQSSPIKNFSLVLTNSTYSYNVTLPKNAVLGDYMVNLTYYNNSALFYTEQVFTVTTSTYLLGVTSTKSRNIYPGTGYGLTFQVAYSNGFMSSQFSNAQVKFISKATNQEEFSAPLQYIGGTSFTINNTNTVPVGLFMGTYNVSIEMLWNSSLTSNSLPTSSSNSTLPFISYQGLPIIQNYTISPLSNRTNLYSGDLFNLTADIGVKNLQNSQVYPVNSSVTMTANFYNGSNSNQLLQQLSTEYLNGSKVSIYGEMNPNINILGDVQLSLSLRIKYSSTNTYNLLYTNLNNITKEFNPTFTYKQANLELDQNSVNYVIGSPKITQNEYTTILITFKIHELIPNSNSQYVTGLKLNASIFKVSSSTSISLPAVTSLEANNSYQLQIPVNTLSTGSYNITISPLNTHINLGSIPLSIVPVQNNNVIPVENYISAGAVLIAVIVSYVAYRIKKKN